LFLNFQTEKKEEEESVALSVVVTIVKSDVATIVRSGEVVVKIDVLEMEEVEVGELDHLEVEEPHQPVTSVLAGMIAVLPVVKKKVEAGAPVELQHEMSAHERNAVLPHAKLKKPLSRVMVGQPLQASVNVEISILRINPEKNQVKIM
jgi:hypothetical protein